MTIWAKTVMVGTTPVALTTVSMGQQFRLLIRVKGSDVYFGPATVTVGNGFKVVDDKEPVEMSMLGADVLYAVSPNQSGTTVWIMNT